MTAAALLETTFVNTPIIIIRLASTIDGGAPNVMYTNMLARKSAPPVLSSARPRASEDTMIRMTWVLSALMASFQFRHPVRMSTRQPSNALISIGMTFAAARPTTPVITASATGALRALGSLMLPSRIRKSGLCLSSPRFSRVDCTSNTSPVRKRVSSIPGVSRSSIPSNRLNASNLSPKRDSKPALPIRTPFKLEAGVMATSAICVPSVDRGWLESTA